MVLILKLANSLYKIKGGGEFFSRGGAIKKLIIHPPPWNRIGLQKAYKGWKRRRS